MGFSMRKSHQTFVHFMFFSVLAFSIQIIAQIKFECTYGGNDWERATIFNLTNDGGYIICGSTRSFTNHEDMYLLKINNISDVEWSKVYQNPGSNSKLHGAKQAADGSYYLCGYIEGGFGFLDDIIIKIDSSGNIIWSKIFGGFEADELRDAFPTPDGGVLVSGQNASFGVGSKEIQAIKFSSTGIIEWAKAYGRVFEEFGASIQSMDNGDFVILGAADISGNYDVRLLLIKVNSNGDLIWAKIYSGFVEDWGRFAIKTTDHGFLIVGDTKSYGLGGSEDIYVIKTDSIGNVEWAKAYGGIGTESGYGAVQSIDGKFVITGFTNSFGSGGYDAFLMKIDLNGNPNWFYTYGGLSNDYAFKVFKTGDSGYAMTGSRSSQSLGGEDVLLIKTDSNGKSLCETGPFNVNVFNITNLQAVNYNLFTTTTISTSNISLTTITTNSAQNFICGELPVELTSFSAEKSNHGVLLHWTAQSELNNHGFEIQRASKDEDFFTIAFVEGEGTTTNSCEYSYLDKIDYSGKEVYHYRLKQLDFNGGFDYSDIINVEFDIPKDLVLLQNYPNPFNPKSVIIYAIPRNAFIKLIVYNSVGEIIAVLEDGFKKAGQYQTEFDGNNLPSGIYFCSLSADGFMLTKKMILLK